MEPLKGFEKKYLRGLAHALKPLVLIGREGVTAGIVRAADEGLAQHELIKIKFNDFNEKEQKSLLTDEIARKTGSTPVGMTGHVSILYRQHPDPEKRRIQLTVKNRRKATPNNSRPTHA
jgi:RNA-binding protein